MNVPDLWGAANPAAWPVLALIGARVGGMMAAVPFFSALQLTRRFRGTFVLAVSVVLAPVVQSPFPLKSTALLPGMIATEILVGFCIGVVVAIFFAGIALAGEVISIQAGLSAASVLSPGAESPLPVLGHFLHLFCLVVWLGMDGHLLLFDALSESFRQVPLGHLPNMQEGFWSLVLLGRMIFITGVQVAAPVMLALLVVNVVLGVLARTAPQMNILISSFPLTIGIGLMITLGMIPLLARYVGAWSEGMPEQIAWMVEAVFGP